MIRRPPRSTQGISSAASDVYKRQVISNMHAASRSCSVEALPRPRRGVRSAPRGERSAPRRLRGAPRPHGALRSRRHGAAAVRYGALRSRHGPSRSCPVDYSRSDRRNAPELLRVVTRKCTKCRLPLSTIDRFATLYVTRRSCLTRTTRCETCWTLKTPSDGETVRDRLCTHWFCTGRFVLLLSAPPRRTWTWSG